MESKACCEYLNEYGCCMIMPRKDGFMQECHNDYRNYENCKMWRKETVVRIKRIPVKSTNIKEIGYDKRTALLEIEFHRGDVYNFFGIPAELFHEFETAESVGGFFYKHIKGKFDFEIKPRSKCCNADTIIYGDVTRYYVCVKCGKPCDTK